MTEELKQYHEELKGLLSNTNQQIKSHAENIDKVQSDLEKLKIELKSAKEEITKIETKTNAPSAPTQNSKEAEALLIKGFKAYLQTGDMKYIQYLTDEDKAIAAFSPLGQKTLAANVDTSGGALVPIVYQRELIAAETNYCPMLEIARLINISEGDVVEVPKQGSTRMGVSVTSETESRIETTNPTLEKIRIQVYDYEARVKATNKLVSDAMFPLDEWLNEEWAAQSAAQFGADCVVGAGDAGPKGFTAETVQSVLSGSAGALSISTLPKLMMAVKPAYRKNGKWAANGATIASVWGLALTTGYQPFVGINPATGALTFAGKDVVEMAELPDIGASAYPIYFGDWMRACWVVNRLDIEVLRNPYLDMGFTWFYFKARRGFALVNSEAIAKMKSNNS